MARLPVSTGVDSLIDGQIPDKWDANWFSKFLQVWQGKGDVRNTTAGAGISITGDSSAPGTIALDTSAANIWTGNQTFNGKVGFNHAPVSLPIIVTGSRGGNAALASLLTALASTGIITNNTTA